MKGVRSGILHLPNAAAGQAADGRADSPAAR
nr:MAG TPA: hypothetical protein [Caudoviricetes sp.]